MGTNTTTSWLDPPEIHGVKTSADNDTYLLSALEITNLNRYLYSISKMLQGGLNLANLNTETNQVFTDMDGNITEISATAAGLAVDVSNLEGDLTSLSVTVDGLRIADETGSYTIIDGDKLVSKDHDSGAIIQIENGDIKLKIGTSVQGDIYGTGSGIMISPSEYLMLGGKVQVGLGNELTEMRGYPIKISSTSNMSIDSTGTIYIGASAGQSGNVTIGQSGGTVSLIGNVYINGVLQ